MAAVDYREFIRDIPDFPSDGILFKDITTLMKNGQVFFQAVNELAAHFQDLKVDAVLGPEARGFAVGAPVAYALQTGFVPVRKPGKLPAETLHYEYQLEYGSDSLEMHRDAIKPGYQVIVIDDLLATGGTTLATVKMVESLGGKVVGLGYLIELSFLKGREKLAGYPTVSLVCY